MGRGLLILIFIVFGFQVFLSAQTLEFGSVDTTMELTNLIEEDFFEEMSIQVLHEDEAVDYFVTLSGNWWGSFYPRFIQVGAEKLEYQVYRDSTKEYIILDTTTSFTENNVLCGSFDEDEASQVASMTFCIPAGQFLNEGNYEKNLTLSLYEGTPDSYTRNAKDTLEIQVTCSIPYYTKAAVVPVGEMFTPSGRSITMDFGLIFWGESQSADIIIRSNVPYKIFLSSEHDGALKNEDEASDDTIPYTLMFDETIKAFFAYGNDFYPLGYYVQPTDFEGDRYNVDVIIDSDYGAVDAGDYSDVVTLTVMTY